MDKTPHGHSRENSAKPPVLLVAARERHGTVRSFSGVNEMDAEHNDEIWSLAVHIFPGSYVKFYVQLRCSILFLL